MVCPPASEIGPITPAQRRQIIASSPVAGVYEKAIDRESAYERLTGKAQLTPTEGQMQQRETVQTQAQTTIQQQGGGVGGMLNEAMGALFGSGNSRRMSPGQAMVNSAARAIGSQVGRQLIRGALGSLLGGSSRR
jgi:hypothetical protein